MKNEPRKPYLPPQITRVVLRTEQAILSACSTDASSQVDMVVMGCAPSIQEGLPEGCTKANSSQWGGDAYATS